MTWKFLRHLLHAIPGTYATYSDIQNEHTYPNGTFYDPSYLKRVVLQLETTADFLIELAGGSELKL